MVTRVFSFIQNFVSCVFKADSSDVYADFWLTVLTILLCIPLLYVLRTILYSLEVSNVTKRSVFITGCDSGFGNLLAKTLDTKGVRVFAGCLTVTGAEELRNEASNRLRTLIVDVRDLETIERAFEYVRDNVGEEGLWGVVNNAGVMPTYGPAEWTSIESFKSTCDVNLFGTISVTLQFLPLLRRSRGRLVCVCSVTSNCPYPGITNYVVSKAAVKSFVGCMRRELKNTGVTLHSIEPGGFKTNLTDQDRIIGMFKESYRRSSPELKCYYGGHISKYLMRGMKLAAKYVSNQPQQVADAMVHALFAKFPKNQYLIGLDTKLFFRAMSFLPEWVDDYILGWPKPYGEIIEELKDIK